MHAKGMAETTKQTAGRHLPKYHIILLGPYCYTQLDIIDPLN